MNAEKMAAMRKRLLDMRERSLLEFRQQNAEAAALVDPGVPDPGDMSMHDYLGDFLHLLSDGKREEILRIDEAITRIDDGTYGVCQSCGEEIREERLDIQPYTPYCIDCKEEIEQLERRQGGPELGKI